MYQLSCAQSEYKCLKSARRFLRAQVLKICAAPLLRSGAPGTHDGAITQYKSMLAYMEIEDAGIVAAAGEENGSEEKLAQARELGKAL